MKANLLAVALLFMSAVTSSFAGTEDSVLLGERETLAAGAPNAALNSELKPFEIATVTSIPDPSPLSLMGVPGMFLIVLVPGIAGLLGFFLARAAAAGMREPAAKRRTGGMSAGPEAAHGRLLRHREPA